VSRWNESLPERARIVMVDFKQCTEPDLQSVMTFIDEHWAKAHVLATSRALMSWQHADTERPGAYNWLLASNEQGVQGVLGFIPTHRYDTALVAEPFTWLALWKIRADAPRGIGLQLLSQLTARAKGPMGVLGINPQHPPMYKALGWQVGELSHHFVCNPDLRQNIVSAPPGRALPLPKAGRAVFTRVDAAALASLQLPQSQGSWPRKTPRYFAGRYLDHPVYDYQIHVISLEGHPRALLATRIAVSGDSKVLRLIDFLGEESAWAESGSGLATLLRETGCEYADLWQYGLQAETLAACGLVQVQFDGAVVVPNYFEPFLQRNGRIEFAVKGVPLQDLRLFRGDGDQDRPNRLPSRHG
jgi:hypothetical protein